MTCAAAFLSGGVDMALLALMESTRAPSCFRVEHSDPVSCRQRKGLVDFEIGAWIGFLLIMHYRINSQLQQ